MGHALAQCDTITATREYDAAGAALYQFRLTAHTQTKGQQATFQALPTVHPNQAHPLPDREIDKRDCL